MACNLLDKKQPLTQAVSKTLASLAETNITQKLPDISNTLTNLQILHPNNKYLTKKTTAKKTTKKKVARKKSTSRKSKPKKTSKKTNNKISIQTDKNASKNTKATVKTIINTDSNQLKKPSSQKLSTPIKIETSPTQPVIDVSKPLPESKETTISADKKTEL